MNQKLHSTIRRDGTQVYYLNEVHCTVSDEPETWSKRMRKTAGKILSKLVGNRNKINQHRKKNQILWDL